MIVFLVFLVIIISILALIFLCVLHLAWNLFLLALTPSPVSFLISLRYFGHLGSSHPYQLSLSSHIQTPRKTNL